jgi:hypothetical protein
MWEKLGDSEKGDLDGREMTMRVRVKKDGLETTHNS